MFVNLILIEIGFLANVGSALVTIDSNGFATYQIGIFKKKNIEFE
jgi:hypothetical protein